MARIIRQAKGRGNRLCGFSTCGIEGAVLIFSKILIGCHEVEGLVGSDLAIEALMVGERAIGDLDGQVAAVIVGAMEKCRGRCGARGAGLLLEHEIVALEEGFVLRDDGQGLGVEQPDAGRAGRRPSGLRTARASLRRVPRDT